MRNAKKSSMGIKAKLIGGAEVDRFTDWNQCINFNHGKSRRIKKCFNKRQRRLSTLEITKLNKTDLWSI